MKFFVDTADINEIKELASTGLLWWSNNQPVFNFEIGQIISSVDRRNLRSSRPVSARSLPTDYETMWKEADKLRHRRSRRDQSPLTPDGLKVCKRLSDEGTMVNVTFMFFCGSSHSGSQKQAQPLFLHLLDDWMMSGQTAWPWFKTSLEFGGNYPDFQTEVLVASIRNPMHIVRKCKNRRRCRDLSPIRYQTTLRTSTDR